MTNQEIGQRVRRCLSGKAQKDVAAAVGMTPDGFSRSLSGQRAFSTLELVRLSELLEADVRWFITGEIDPMRMRVAARHIVNTDTWERTTPDWPEDRALLQDVELAYRQAYIGSTSTERPNVPETADEVRAVLGASFIRPFIERVEDIMGVDVVRIAGLSHDYSLAIGDHRVIVIGATGNWFYENWSIAHELGHLCLGHLREVEESRAHESAANHFAAELLLPESLLRSADWAVGIDELARQVWELGVSTMALKNRLQSLGMTTPTALDESTQRLLHRSTARLESGSNRHAISARMEAAAVRRFPLHLREAHLDAIADGRLQPATLAWMLGVDPADLDLDSPSDTQPPRGELDAIFGPGE